MRTINNRADARNRSVDRDPDGSLFLRSFACMARTAGNLRFHAAEKRGAFLYFYSNNCNRIIFNVSNTINPKWIRRCSLEIRTGLHIDTSVVRTMKISLLVISR